MKRFILLIAVAGLLFSCNNKPAPPHHNHDHAHAKDSINHKCCKDSTAHKCCADFKDGVFVHISSNPDDAHQVLMGLTMAMRMVETQDVLVYIDVHAASMVIAEEGPATFEGFDDSHQIIKQILEGGGKVFVCPTCLKVAGFSEDQLLEGVQLANKDAFFNFTKGRILSFDY